MPAADPPTIVANPEHEYSIAHTDTLFSLGNTSWSDHAASPYKVLRELINSLQTNRVLGPLLVRSESEYNNDLGQGAYSEVRAANTVFSERHDRARRSGAFRGGALAPDAIAIKKHRSRQNRPTSKQEAQDFLARHFIDAWTEVQALSHPKLRNHRNIVKLLAWGLCLDALEDNLRELNIPLLILERAHGDLCSLLQQDKGSSTPLIQDADRYSLCVDIGHGLEALHELGFAHGDLKTANVLIFITSDKTVAKLCDFGTIIDVRECSGFVRASPRYRGTPGWRAPETFDSSQTVNVLSCDVYSYGLVIWSLFVGHGKSCLLNESMEMSSDVLDQAKDSIGSHLRQTELSDSNDSQRIINVVSQCLQYDPASRSQAPWKTLLSSPTPRNKKVKHDSERRFPTFWCHPPLRAVAQMRAYFQTVVSASRPLPSSHRLTIDSKVMGYRIFFERLGLLDWPNSNSEDLPLDIVNSAEIIQHEDDKCVKVELFADLAHSIWRSPTTASKEDWYNFARFRSRLNSCCVQGALRNYYNYVYMYLYRGPKVNLHTLAWLCRGPAGEAEVAQLAPNVDYALFDRSYSESQRLAFMLLLLSKGFPIETRFRERQLRANNPVSGDLRSPQGCSIFEYFLRSFRDAAVSTVVQILCEKFNALRADRRISQATREFILGGVHPMKETALHVCANRLDYEAVVSLLQIGANPEAKNIRGQDVYACIPDAEAMNDQQKLSRIRLKRLLVSTDPTLLTRSQGPTEGSSSSLTPLLSRDIAHGWSCIKIHGVNTTNSFINSAILFLSSLLFRMVYLLGGPRESDSAGAPPPDQLYRELFTGSLTFQKPHFSLLENGNIALGYRKLQNYRLDLISFLTPQTTEKTKHSLRTRFPIIDEEWYRREPVTEEMTDDPLADLQSTWFSGLRDLRLPSFPATRENEKATICAWLTIICVYVVIYLFINAAGRGWFGPFKVD